MTARSLCLTYLVLAIAGAAATWAFNILFMIETGGFDLLAFLKGGFANYAAGSLTADVLVAAAAFVVWMLQEARRLGMRHRWVYVALTFGIAVAFAFPFFLFMRQRRLDRLGHNDLAPSATT